MRMSLTHSLRKVVEVLVVASIVALCSAAGAQQKFTDDFLPTNSAANYQAPQSGYDVSLFSSLRWRNIGPDRGGRSIASAGVVKRPLEY